jgi:hypothetical protein
MSLELFPVIPATVQYVGLIWLTTILERFILVFYRDSR